MGLSTTQFLYVGNQLVAEYDGAGTLLRRYVHGPGTDDPMVWYEGSGLSNKRWFHADERGSIVATSDGTGAATVYNYGPFGEPAVWEGSRFRYTGQLALPEAKLYYYKARMYDPLLGRFLQVDPVGFEDDVNLYAYVGNDPLNKLDPFGETGCADMGSQGLSGGCLDSSNFKADKDGSQTVVATAAYDAVAKQVAPSLEDKKTERGTTIDRAEEGSLKAGSTSQGTNDPAGQKTAIVLRAETEAVIHSHPNNSDFGIQPGFREKGVGDHIAVERGYPNYITRDGDLIVVERSGGQYRVRVIDGSISSLERRAIKDVLNLFQRDSRSRGR